MHVINADKKFPSGGQDLSPALPEGPERGKEGAKGQASTLHAAAVKPGRRVGLAPGRGRRDADHRSVSRSHSGVAGGIDARDRLPSGLERPTTPVAACASGSPVSWFPLYRRGWPARRAGTRTGGDKSVEENPCGVTCRRASADGRPGLMGALGVGRSVVGGSAQAGRSGVPAVEGDDAEGAFTQGEAAQPAGEQAGEGEQGVVVAVHRRAPGHRPRRRAV